MDTATELWADGKFILKRLLEQHEYRTALWLKYISKDITIERYWELYDSQEVVTEKLRKRFDELFGYLI